MFTDPRELLDQTLDNLETLAVFLADEVDERLQEHQRLTPAARTCKEALQTVKVLIPKLRDARAARLDAAPGQLRLCVDCE